MGEIAEMTLEGILCEGCGEAFHDDPPGYPRRCARCQRERSGGPAIAPRDFPSLGKKDFYWLKAASCVGSGMYSGEKWKCAPARFQKLHRLGLVSRYYPHNHGHDDRAIITPDGEAVLNKWLLMTGRV